GVSGSGRSRKARRGLQSARGSDRLLTRRTVLSRHPDPPAPPVLLPPGPSGLDGRAWAARCEEHDAALPSGTAQPCQASAHTGSGQHDHRETPRPAEGILRPPTPQHTIMLWLEWTTTTR